MRSATAEPEGTFCQAVLLIARYQGAQYGRWRHPCHARQSATPVRHNSSATEYHNAYAVDPTVYTATYTASMGASPMGQINPPFGQRVFRTMKHISERFSTTVAPLNLMRCILYTHIEPTCRGLNGYVRASLGLSKGDTR